MTTTLYKYNSGIYKIAITIDTPLNSNPKHIFIYEEITKEKYDHLISILNESHFLGDKAILVETTTNEFSIQTIIKEKYIVR